MDTQARKLTIFGCLSPSSDFPNSISCAKDSFSGSLLLSVYETILHDNDTYKMEARDLIINNFEKKKL